MLSATSKISVIFSLVLLFALDSSVRANSDDDAYAPEVIRVRDLPKDFLLPATLWDQLLVHEIKGAGVALPDEPGASTMSSVLFSSITVILTEKNSGVLKEPVIRIEFPKGGGEVDLSQWTTGKPGSFFVRFVFPGELSPTFEAYHLSKTRKRKVDGRIYGGGCRFFYKVTKLLLKPADSRGLAVNTTKDFHVSTLGGHFLFAWQDQEATQVSQVRFTSSNNPDLFCQTWPAAAPTAASAAEESAPESGH